MGNNYSLKAIRSPLSLQEETSCDLGWGSAASFPDEIIQALFKYLPFAFDLQGPEQGSDQEEISGMMIQKNNVSQRPHWAASTSPGLSDFPSATSKKERKKEGRKEVFDCRSDLTNASSDRQKSFNLLIHCQKKLHWIFGNWPIDVGWRWTPWELPESEAKWFWSPPGSRLQLSNTFLLAHWIWLLFYALKLGCDVMAGEFNQTVTIAMTHWKNIKPKRPQVSYRNVVMYRIWKLMWDLFSWNQEIRTATKL